MALKPDTVEIGSGCDLVLQVERIPQKKVHWKQKI